MIDELLYINNR